MRLAYRTYQSFGGLIGSSPEAWSQSATFVLEPGDLDGEHPLVDEKIEEACDLAGFYIPYSSGPGHTFVGSPSYHVDPDFDPEHVYLTITQRGGWDV